MNIEYEIKNAIEEIKSSNGDDEKQHAIQDDIYFRVLESIALGDCKNPVKVCKLAMTIKDMDFARHCA